MRSPEAAEVQQRLVRPPTLQERVLQELRVQLARGRFAPGERVNVDALAAEFAVSPLPVREALRVLHAEGRLAYSSHRGYRMTSLTLADVEEIFLVCRLLEAEALRRGVPAMTDAAIGRMRELLHGFDGPASGTPLWERVALHREFHFVPIEHAGLPRLTAQLRTLWEHTDHYRGLYLFRDELAHRALAHEHGDLLAACERRDPGATVELMNRHRDHAIAWLARGLDTGGAS